MPNRRGSTTPPNRERHRRRAILCLYPAAEMFENAQGLRKSLSGGPLSPREQQIVNLVVARHWNARYPWFAQVRRSLSVGIDQGVIDAINAHKTPNLSDAREKTCFTVAQPNRSTSKGVSDATYAAAEKAMGLESLVAPVASIGSFSMTCMTAGTFGIEPPAANPTPLLQSATHGEPDAHPDEQ